MASSASASFVPSSSHSYSVSSLFVPLPLSLLPDPSSDPSHADRLDFSFSIVTDSQSSSLLPFPLPHSDSVHYPRWRSSSSCFRSLPLDLFRLSTELTFLISSIPLTQFDHFAQLCSRYLFLKPFFHDSPFPFIYACQIKFRLFNTDNQSNVKSNEAVEHCYDFVFSPSLLPNRQDTTSWGRADYIMETPVDLPASPINFGVYLLHIAPNATIEPHYHRELKEWELVLTDGLISQNVELTHGQAKEWEGKPHFYRNTSQSDATILCIDSPIFNKSDEIKLPDAEADEVYRNPPEGKSRFISHSVLASPRVNFQFPGAFPGQINHLTIVSPSLDLSASVLSEFPRPDAVLIFAFNDSDGLLMVEHHKRGWELIGGKLEPNETPEDAIMRESMEEGAIEIDRNSIRLIGQYRITEPAEKQTESGEAQLSLHTKSVYFARIARVAPESELVMETKSRRFVTPPSWCDIHSDSSVRYSTLLKDNVYAACLNVVNRWIQLHPRS